ncbi:MAG: TetR/AcrR family transcriptional regulator [Anaerobutyricum soehngenii]
MWDVYMNEIASRLGVTKAALYKHYSSKQEILDSIVERMNQMDVKRAKEYEMPDGDMEDVIAGYKTIALEKIKQFYKSTVSALDGRRIFLLFPKNADIRTVQRS